MVLQGAEVVLPQPHPMDCSRSPTWGAAGAMGKVKGEGAMEKGQEKRIPRNYWKEEVERPT